MFAPTGDRPYFSPRVEEEAIDMKVPRIVVVGSVNADMVVKSQRLPAPGETVIGGQFVMRRGVKEPIKRSPPAAWGPR